MKKTLIISALKSEINNIIEDSIIISKTYPDRFSCIIDAQLKNKDIVLAYSGIGRDRMIATLEHIWEEHIISRCLHIGVCGGTFSDIKNGELIIPNFIVNEDGEKIELSMCGTANISANKHFTGGIITCDKIVKLASEKKELGAKHNVIGLDMESFYVAKFCKEKDCSLTIARAVLDDASTNLEIPEKICNPDGSPKIVKCATALISKRGTISTFAALKKLSATAIAAITQFAREYI